MWTRHEVLHDPCPVPPEPGIYGWHFTAAPHVLLPVNQLLYVGIAPRHTRDSSRAQTLRKRVRYHFRGDASRSTLRMSLGCLLGFELRRTGSGRFTLGPRGEAELSDWMEHHARVCWVPLAQPRLMETQALEHLDLPLNLAGNGRHPFHPELTRLRAHARVRARGLPDLGS